MLPFKALSGTGRTGTYAEEDASGCNWSPEVYWRTSQGNVTPALADWVAQIVRAARALFNVRD